jgi:hypothetical protein
MTRTQAFGIFRTLASRLALPARLPQFHKQTAITRTAYSRRSYLTIERTLFAPSRKGHLLNTKTKQPLPGRTIGSEYLITSDKTELPRGSRVTVLPGFPVETGDLVMFQVGRHTSIGRWLPNVASAGWIRQPGRLICVIGEVPVHVAGPVLLCPPLDVCATGQIKASPGSRN